MKKEVNPGHHQLEGTLDVALSVDARGDNDSVVASSFLPQNASPSNMTLDSATTESSELPRFREELGGKQLPRCVRFFRWLQLVARGGKCAGCHGRSADVCQRTNLADFRHLWRLCSQTITKDIFLRGFDRDRVQGHNVS